MSNQSKRKEIRFKMHVNKIYNLLLLLSPAQFHFFFNFFGQVHCLQKTRV